MPNDGSAVPGRVAAVQQVPACRNEKRRTAWLDVSLYSHKQLVFTGNTFGVVPWHGAGGEWSRSAGERAIGSLTRVVGVFPQFGSGETGGAAHCANRRILGRRHQIARG